MAEANEKNQSVQYFKLMGQEDARA